MKKNGFTLAEALISLAIIGVIAAIAAPMINKFKPDEDKVAFLKTYDSIVEVVKNIADNTRLYPLAAIDSDGNNIDFSEKPLENVVQINDFNGTGSNYPSATGKDKLCEILADAFKAAPATTCATSNLTLGKINFSTKDGVDFYMSTRWPSGTDTYKTTIKFDINGSEGQNCVSGESGCTKPDQFEVLVSSAGRVVASDVMAQKYLQTRGSYRKADYDVSGLTKITELPDVFTPECINDTVYKTECHDYWCEKYPNDTHCIVDPCVENPDLPECKKDPCEENPDLPECKKDPCEENPDLPECKEVPNECSNVYPPHTSDSIDSKFEEIYRMSRSQLTELDPIPDLEAMIYQYQGSLSNVKISELEQECHPEFSGSSDLFQYYLGLLGKLKADVGYRG